MSKETENSRARTTLEGLPSPINDDRPVFERLMDYTTRGTDSPESLSLNEIRQISFALALYLSRDDRG